MANGSTPAGDTRGMTSTLDLPADEQIHDLTRRVLRHELTPTQLGKLQDLLIGIGVRLWPTRNEGVKADRWDAIAEKYAELIATL